MGQQLSVKTKIRVAADVASALEYLENQSRTIYFLIFDDYDFDKPKMLFIFFLGIVHRDVALRNVLFSKIGSRHRRRRCIETGRLWTSAKSRRNRTIYFDDRKRGTYAVLMVGARIVRKIRMDGGVRRLVFCISLCFRHFELMGFVSNKTGQASILENKR